MTDHTQVTLRLRERFGDRDYIVCDEQIADLVYLFNKNGFETSLSCQSDGNGDVWFHFPFMFQFDQFVAEARQNNYPLYEFIFHHPPAIHYDESGTFEPDETGEEVFIPDGEIYKNIALRFGPECLDNFRELMYKSYGKPPEDYLLNQENH